jgi:uncharacterized protein (DUF849 family)
MSRHLPVTPDEIVEAGIDAARAGASIIHVHVRDPETGEPSSDLDLFREVATGIKAETEAIVQPTTGGGNNQSVQERIAVVPALEPEMASCNMGSMNFGLHPMIDAVDEFEYEWEREYLEDSRDFIFSNTFETLERLLATFERCGTRPELECYDVGHLYNAKHLLEEGHLDPPIHLQFVMGVLGGVGAHEAELIHMVETTDRLFGDDASWSVIGGGRKQFPLCVQAASMGGHVRVGLEDNLYLSKGELAESNADQVKKIVDLAWDVTGREPATPAEVREFLGLKGRDSVGF